ncbi:hypothetical protein [Nesterenkonia flava]|uniref:Uncharacterized protein n=1 Tax=Nesterenkonia flava TaxID=469799 RepID=A0ABU1FSV5_9MICC|nr:hypothetical protein [Nesterenkonia flava]MDR5711407.1 hypothetical protein [Nesterenkonia flava]
MPETPTAPAWGVTVTDVVALASQADVHPDATGETIPVEDDVFGGAQAQINKRIKTSVVEKWILDAGNAVSIALMRRHRLGVDVLTEFESALPTVVKTHAAAILVDAAYPQRAGVQDNASYGNVLWQRYRVMLEDLKEALDDLIANPPTTEDPTPRLGPAGGFPPPIFRDEWVRENTPEDFDGVAPGAEVPDYLRRGW